MAVVRWRPTVAPMPPGPPDSKPPRKRRAASLDDTIDEQGERDRAVAAAIEREVAEALAAEQPDMELPRTRTPAEASMRAAIDEIRRLAPDWHVAEHMARLLEALADQLEDDRATLGRLLAAERAVFARRLAALEQYPITAKRALGRFRAAIAGSLLTALGAVAAVVYGAGVKSGHADGAEERARTQAAMVERHDAQLRRVCVRDQSQDGRLDEHDHLLSLPSRRLGRDTDDCGATP